MTGVRRVFAGRNKAMCDMYLSGSTYAEIGQRFDLTRQAVQQTLKRYFSVDRNCRPEATKRLDAIATKIEKIKIARQTKEQLFVMRWGMSFDEAKKLSPLGLSEEGHPFRRFARQKQNAKNRGVAWELTFSQWWRIWQESGRWDERGPRGYCMGRYGDSGPYSESNVYICTIGQNFSDSYLVHTAADRIAKRKAREASAVALNA